MRKLESPCDFIEAVLREEHLCEEAPRVAGLIARRLAGVMGGPSPGEPARGIRVEEGRLTFVWVRPAAAAVDTSSASPDGTRAG